MLNYTEEHKALARQLKQDGLESNQIIAELNNIFGITPDRKTVWRWTNDITKDLTEEENENSANSFLYTDWLKTIKLMESAKTDNRFVKIAWLTDVHFPYHSQPVIDLFYQVISDFQPKIVPGLSDFWDAPNISNFATTPKQIGRDYIKPGFAYYEEHSNIIKSIIHDVIIPIIIGNHDQRLLLWMLANAPQMADWIGDSFVNAIRKHGIFNGWGVYTYWIYNLVITHGYRHGANALYKTLDELYADIVLMGHLHTVKSFLRTKNYRMQPRTIGGYLVGCACQLSPHYFKNRIQIGDWQNGFALITIDTHTDKIYVDNLTVEWHNKVACLRWGDKEYKAW